MNVDITSCGRIFIIIQEDEMENIQFVRNVYTITKNSADFLGHIMQCHQNAKHVGDGERLRSIMITTLCNSEPGCVGYAIEITVDGIAFMLLCNIFIDL